MNKREKKTK